MLSTPDLNIGKLKDPVLVFVVLTGGSLLHFGKPTDGSVRTMIEMIMTGMGMAFFLLGLAYLLIMWVRGTVSNSDEDAIFSGVKQNVKEDRRRRGFDE